LTITEIRFIGKHKREVLVTLDDTNRLQLTPETYRTFAHHLRKEHTLNQAEVAEIEQTDLVIRAKAALTRFLGYRARSEHECRTMLARKGYALRAIDQSVERFLELNLIDPDPVFAERFVRDRILLKPEGRSKLLARLREKGIPADVAKGILDKLYPREKELDAALELGRRKCAKLGDKPTDARKKLLSFLTYRGFNYDISQKVLAELDP